MPKKKIKQKPKKKHIEYILAVYKKRTAKQMAEHITEKMDFPISVKELRYIMRKMGLVKNRPWTEEEDLWIIESIGDTPPKIMAKELFRTMNAIYDRISFLNLKVVDKSWMITTPEVVSRAKIHRPMLYKACKEGLIEGATQTKIKHGLYVFEEEGLHNWLVKHHPYYKGKCWHCDKRVVGSLYCKYHLPNYIKLKPSTPSSANISETPNKTIQDQIIEFIREVRLKYGMTQIDLAKKLGVDVIFVRKLEGKKFKRLDVQTCNEIMSKLNIDFTIKLNIKGDLSITPP